MHTTTETDSGIFEILLIMSSTVVFNKRIVIAVEFTIMQYKLLYCDIYNICTRIKIYNQ